MVTDIHQSFVYDPKTKLWWPIEKAEPDVTRRYINYLRKKRGGKRADRLEAYLKSQTRLAAMSNTTETMHGR